MAKEIINFLRTGKIKMLRTLKICTLAPRIRRGARVAEEARLESVCASKAYRGFESLSLRESNYFDKLNFKLLNNRRS